LRREQKEVANGGAVVPVGRIQQRILLIRGEKVIIDEDLAEFYGVPTKALNQAVRRNEERFPQDVMFQLTGEEKAEVVTNCDHLSKLKFSKSLPYAFTEHGGLMAGEDEELEALSSLLQDGEDACSKWLAWVIICRKRMIFYVRCRIMTTIDKLEREVQKLSREELAAFRNWFRKYDSEEWDRQIEQDAISGRLDSLADEAIREHQAGRTREI
jgi:hypothetical protein